MPLILDQRLRKLRPMRIKLAFGIKGLTTRPAGVGDQYKYRIGSGRLHRFNRGTAHSEYITGEITRRISFIAPVLVVPGEEEMEALARLKSFLWRRKSVYLPSMAGGKLGAVSHRIKMGCKRMRYAGFESLLFVTDGGMNIAPNLAQMKEILENILLYLKGIEIDSVNVIVLTANEVENPKMPSTMHAQALAEMSLAGEFPGAIVEGPLALDGAVSAAALKHKGISSQINGEFDLFLVPSIKVGNVLGKSMVYFAGATMAGIVLGAQVPIVLTARNDTPRSKFMALTMAALNRGL